MNETNITLTNSSIPGTSPHFSIWAQYTRIVYFCLIVMFGIMGNSLVLVLQTRNKSKSSTDWLVTTMAGIDLCGAGISCSLYIVMATGRIIQVEPTSRFCQGHFYFIYVTSVTSALLLCAVAIDRYSKTCHPHSKIISIKRAKLISIITVASVVCLYIPAIVIYEYNTKEGGCRVMMAYKTIDTVIKASMSLALIMLFFITVFSYMKVAVAIRNLRMSKDCKTKRADKSISIKHRILKQNKISPEPSTSNPEGQGQCIKMKTFPILTSKKKFCVDCKQSSSREGDILCESGHYRLKDCRKECTVKAIRYEQTDIDKPAKKCSIELKVNIEKERTMAVENGLVLTKQKANTTTKIMFLLTILFIATYAVNILTGVLTRAFANIHYVVIIMRLLHPVYTLNFVSNPIFYICLSSKYRQKVYSIFCAR